MSSFTISWKKEVPSASVLRNEYRKQVAKLIVDAVRIRVSTKGQGAEGVLKGYSRNPISIEPGVLKPKRKPARGWYSHHQQGYYQYRKELGLQAELFVFSNKGSAWRDWNYLDMADQGPILFGFESGANSQAADAAIDNGRPDMFEPGDVELNDAAQKLLDTILDRLFG